MTRIFNRISEREKRQLLRHNMPKAEVIVWDRIRKKQIENCRFRRQYSVDRFVIDFYAPELKLAIEVDGESHFQDDARERDRERQALIESIGISFLRFTNDEVYSDMDSVVGKISASIRELRMQRETTDR